jgi:hypothetical protein
LEVAEVVSDELSIIEFEIKKIRKQLAKRSITVGASLVMIMMIQQRSINACETIIELQRTGAFDK